MMNNVPKFSVIIPLYNKRPYIRRAVDSVLGQTVSDFELIVVDDGSTDGSLDELADIDDRRLRIIRQENRGGAGGQARNTGMAQARGEWFTFLDGDDMWLPNHVEEIVRIIECYPEPGLVSPRSKEVLQFEGVPIDLREISDIRRIDYFYEFSKIIGLNNCSSTAIHREVFAALGGFINVRSGPDLEYWARIALQFPVTISDRVTSIYIRGTGGNMERIATERSQPRPWPVFLRNVSPSIAMLCDRAEQNPDLLNNPSVRAYVNSRLECGMRGALYRGDPGRARDLVGLMMPPLNWKQRFYCLGLSLPAWFLLGFLSSYRYTRRLASILKKPNAQPRS